MLMPHRVASGTHQLTSDIGRNSETNIQLVNDLKVQAETIVKGVESNSALFNQFAANQEICGSLAGNLESIAPKLGSLTASIRGLDEKETGLVQKMEELASTFSEAHAQAQAQAKARMDSEAFNQSINNDLQLQLEEASAQLSIAKANLEANETEKENIRLSLSEATAQTRAAESRATRLESEVAALQGNIEAIEQKVREELNRASVVSRDQTRAKFEQQLHKALKEKMDMEKGSEKIKEQLASAQQSLVSVIQSYGASLTDLRLKRRLRQSNRGQKSKGW